MLWRFCFRRITTHDGVYSCAICIMDKYALSRNDDLTTPFHIFFNVYHDVAFGNTNLDSSGIFMWPSDNFEAHRLFLPLPPFPSRVPI